ncbi:MAG: hypothetical protein AAGD92_15735 [Pseudomonadota bacterium]
MTIVFDPAAPLWAMGLVCVTALIIAAVSLWRNWKSGLFRLLALAGLFGLLANPLVREAERSPLDDIALILVDESASQSLDGRDDSADAAASALQTALARLDAVETRRVAYSGEEETRTIGALQSALADIPRARLGGVFIVTDGQSADASETLSGLDAPVHLLITGDENEVDRKLTLTNAPRYGIVDKPVRVSFRVDDLGPDETIINENASVEVTLFVNGEQILQEPVPLGTEVGFEAPLDRPGATIIELVAASRNGELTDRNNIAVLPITAIRDRLRVLLISGEPHPGERVWRNLLKSDPAVDLVHFTILRPTDKNDNIPTSELALIPFPYDDLFIEKVTEFDLVIFDRYTYRAVLDSFHFDNIARYVDGGGAILIAAGPEYNGPNSLASRRNLSFILPAMPSGIALEEPYRPQITDLGQRHPVTAGLPEEGFWGRWLRIMPVEQRAGQALMAGPGNAPLLILNRVEDGRIGLFLSDHVWLWARGFDGGGPHAELLRRIAHWLMKEPELEEEALSLTSDDDALIVSRRTVEDAPGAVELEYPDGSLEEIALEEIEPGLFSARVETAPRGLYRARSGQLFAIGAIGLAAPSEFTDVISTQEKLAQIAESVGGGAFRTGRDGAIPSVRKVARNGARSGDDWAGVRRRNAAQIEAVRDRPAAPPWLWLSLIALSLVAAWAIEGERFSRKPAPAPAKV